MRYIFILVLTIGYDVQNRLHQFCDLQLAPIWMGITLGTSSQGSRNVSNWKVHKQFIIAEIFLILNFLNILRVYLRLGQKMNHSRSNLSRLIFIEAPVARLPLAVLFIDILHNGAVAFHVHGTLGRLLANIFIWIVLVVGGGVVIFFRDWYSRALKQKLM